MKQLSFLLLFFFSVSIFSQSNNSISPKYIIVKSNFDFLKQEDSYKTSSFTKFLFNKAGFNTYLDNEKLPEELVINRCNSLYADVKDKSGMFITRNYIVLSDCKGSIVYSSKNGFSKIKDFERAYRQSIRSAFSSIQKLDSVYNSSTVAAIQINNKYQVKNNSKKKDRVDVFKPVEKQKKTPSYPLLYAQKIENGYQLVNTKPAIKFVILKTNNEKKFFIQDKNGTLVKSGDYWIAEYYEGNNLITENYLIKF